MAWFRNHFFSDLLAFCGEKDYKYIKYEKITNIRFLILVIGGGWWRHKDSKPVTVAGGPSSRKLTNTEQILANTDKY